MSGYFFGNLSGDDDDPTSYVPTHNNYKSTSKKQISLIAGKKDESSSKKDDDGEDLGEKSVAIEEDKGNGTHKSCESDDMEESKSDLVKNHSAQHQSSEQQSTDEPTTKSEKTTSQSSEPVSPQKHNRFAFKHKHLHKNIGDENDDDIPTDICSRRLSILTESTEKIREEFNDRRLHLLNSLSDAIYRGRLLTLNLSHSDLLAKDATLISIALTFNPNIGILKLSGNNLGDEGTKIIAKAIHSNGSIHHAKLHTLDLGFNNMSDDGCIALVVHAISRNFNLRSLHLSGNLISDKGAIALASVIVSGCGLEKLYLAVNKIGSDGAKALTRAVAESDARSRYLKEGGDPSKIAVDPSNIHSLQFSFIKELVLGYNTFGTSGSLSVSNMILTNSSIRVLCMCKNNLGDRELALLSQALTRNKTVPMEVLKLSFNNFSCVGVESLMNAVWGSKHLKELRLDNNRIADRGAQLTAVLLGSVQLKTLDLGFNRIGTVGIKALMKSLSENAFLKYLSLSGNILDNISSKALSYALAYNTSLQKLYLDKCQISYIGQRHVAAGIVSNGHLKLQEVTGIQLAAIVVTLGFPKDCENWDNHQILFFVRTMWQNETYNKYETKNKKSERENIKQQTVSGQEDTKDSYRTNDDGNVQKISTQQQAPNTGPRNPDTVVAAANRLFSTKEGVESIMNSLYYRFAKAKKGDFLSPNKPLIIEKTLSCSITFHPSVEYQLKYDESNYSQSQSVSQVRETSPQKEEKMEGSASTPLFNCIYSKPFRFDFLEHLVGILREISSAPYVEEDFQQLWTYFFPTDAIPSKTISRKSISDISLRKSGMNSRYKYSNDLMLNGNKMNQTFAMHENESNQQATGKRRSLNYTNIESTQRPTLKRLRSNSINDRPDRYPRIKHFIRMNKLSKHETLVMLRRLKCMENAQLYKTSQDEAIYISETMKVTYSPSDLETVLLDLI